MDGELKGEATPSIGNIPHSVPPLTIGAWPAGIEWFAGTIDEVAIYKKALVKEEINQDMKKGVRAVTAVELKDKLADTRGRIKGQE